MSLNMVRLKFFDKNSRPQRCDKSNNIDMTRILREAAEASYYSKLKLKTKSTPQNADSN